MIKLDSYIWGTEEILCGNHVTDPYTLKRIRPKKGRDGVLSLQYHRFKTESWVIEEGVAWFLLIDMVSSSIKTGSLHPMQHLHIPALTIHRLGAVSPYTSILETSTPDIHAADKSQPKDVVRLHCVHGRVCEGLPSTVSEKVINKAIELTELAIGKMDRGVAPSWKEVHFNEI